MDKSIVLPCRGFINIDLNVELIVESRARIALLLVAVVDCIESVFVINLFSLQLEIDVNEDWLFAIGLSYGFERMFSLFLIDLKLRRRSDSTGW